MKKGKNKKWKPILSVDFDGVIHSYKSGWKGPRCIPDDPVPGALSFLVQSLKHFDIHIFSSRARYFGGKWAMKKYLEKAYVEIGLADSPLPQWFMKELCERSYCESYYHDVLATAKSIVKDFKFPTKKPPSHLHIDDRAHLFSGAFPAMEYMINFKPWNRKEI